MKSITIATDGLIDDINSLTIATRGLIQPEVPVEEIKIVIPEEERLGGVRSPTVFIRKKYERLEEPKRDILRDDEEVLEIIIQTMLSGIID